MYVGGYLSATHGMPELPLKQHKTCYAVCGAAVFVPEKALLPDILQTEVATKNVLM